MNWIKKNPVLTGIAAFFAVVIIALGYLVYTASANLAEVNASYKKEVRDLQTLQNSKPYPNEENLEKSAAALEQYTQVVSELKTNLMGRQLETKDISPQGFQDRLRQEVSGVQQRASASEVQLGPNFYLGFNEYQNSLPEPEAAPLLARQLEEILYVVNSLIELRVEAILAVNRPPLPEESGISAAATPTPTPRNTKRRRQDDKQETRTGPVLIKRPFDVAFRSKQGKFRQAFNSLLDAPDFLIVRAINVQNSAQEGPLIINDGAEQPVAAAPQPQPSGSTQSAADLLLGGGPTPGAGGDSGSVVQPVKDLRMVVGRESLTVILRLEALDFEFPVDSEEPEKQASNSN